MATTITRSRPAAASYRGEDLDWMLDGLCAQTDPELFFPENGANPNAAVRVCRACPVLTQCAIYAIARPGLDGIWGATTPRQRRAMRRHACPRSVRKVAA